MANFDFDRKTEYEGKAKIAIKVEDWKKALFHTAKAAEFTFSLAEQNDGALTVSYYATTHDEIFISQCCLPCMSTTN